MSFVKASYESVYGAIVSHWEIKQGTFVLNIEIPANTTSTVILPTAKVETINVNGSAFDAVNTKAEKPSLKLGSGVYTIECAL